MKKLFFTYLSLLCVVLSSCYTYKVYPKKYRTLENKEPKQNAYIINDSLKQEWDILVNSDLFIIVSDRTLADVEIVLYPLERAYTCGQPFVLSAITIGQFPVLYTDRYIYRFDEIKGKAITKRELKLKVAQRVWFWDMFVFKKRFEEHAGKSLLGEYQNM